MKGNFPDSTCFQGFAFLFTSPLSFIYKVTDQLTIPTMLINRYHPKIGQNVLIITANLCGTLFCSKACTFYLLAIRGKADTVNWLVKIKAMYHTFTNQTDKQGSSLCKGRRKRMDHLNNSVSKELKTQASLVSFHKRGGWEKIPPQKLFSIVCLMLLRIKIQSKLQVTF